MPSILMIDVMPGAAREKDPALKALSPAKNAKPRRICGVGKRKTARRRLGRESALGFRWRSHLSECFVEIPMAEDVPIVFSHG